MSENITFNCQECGTTLGIDESNPPNDTDIFCCNGCGREIGPYGQVKAALVETAKAELDKMVESTFGKKPTWRKG